LVSKKPLDQEGKETIITVTVDTENITEDNVLDYVSLSDNQGGEGPNPTEYTTPVDPGERIKWQGEPADPYSDQKVKITKIVVKGDAPPSVLRSGSYRGLNVVRGRAKESSDGGVDSYSITFKIVGGDRAREFTFDPKIKMSSN
jgi:hypothetical protein